MEFGNISIPAQARDIITRIEETSGTITSSLFLAGKQAGEAVGVAALAALSRFAADFSGFFRGNG